MNKIQNQLQKIKQEKRVGLMTHVVVGYPTLDATVQLVQIMADSGVDFVELQIPFSDPLADGPTIMKACEASLKNGTRVQDAFLVAKELSSKISIPLLFMAYYNTVFHYGVRKFCQNAQSAGISGLIVPDMPLEEEQNEHFFKFCKQFGLVHIQVLSPASTILRIQKNAKIANGFVYCTARQATTGAKNELDLQLKSYLKTVKQYIHLPIAVGFGIAKKDHVAMLSQNADIAVIGSALIDEINKSNQSNLTRNISQFLKNIRVTGVS